METLAVVLTPWATERILRDHPQPSGKITKQSIKDSLAAFPDTEFWTVGGPGIRSRMTLTTREARDFGIDLLEVRYDNMRSLAAVYLDNGEVTVR